MAGGDGRRPQPRYPTQGAKGVITMRRTWSPLKQRADFLRIAASGLRRVTPAFILQAATVKTGETGRIGFTCSRKVGNAVARNRARRRLRAIADQVMAPAMTQNLDFVLVGRGEALTRDFAAMTEDLRHAIGKVSTARASTKTTAKATSRAPA